jgi:hypothetical protein
VGPSRHAGTTSSLDYGCFDNETKHDLCVLDSCCQEMCIFLWSFGWCSGTCTLLLRVLERLELVGILKLGLDVKND